MDCGGNRAAGNPAGGVGGTPQDVYERPRTEFVADFVGASNQIAAVISDTHDDGSFDAELEGVGRVRAAGVEGLVAGQRARAIVRPEAIAPLPGGAGRASVSGRVLDLAYLGTSVS